MSFSFGSGYSAYRWLELMPPGSFVVKAVKV